jgi:hypothetical protein
MMGKHDEARARHVYLPMLHTLFCFAASSLLINPEAQMLGIRARSQI